MTGRQTRRSKGLLLGGRGMTSSVLARALTLPVTSGASFATIALTIGYAGADVYGVISLIATLSLLLPFADLGLGVVVTNAFARDDSTAEIRASALKSSLAAMVIPCVTIWLAAIAGTTLFSWSAILGIDALATSGVDLAIAAGLSIFAASLPFSLGQRMLIGLMKNHLALLVSPIGSIAVLLGTIVAVRLSWSPILLAILPPVGIFLTAVWTSILGWRLSGLTWQDVLAARSAPMAALGTGRWMLLVSVGVATALQSGRIVLSHVGGDRDLAVYSICMQLYATLWSLYAAAGFALWPRFTQRRTAGEPLEPQIRSAFRPLMASAFVSAPLFVGTLPSVVLLLSGSQIRVSWWMAASLAVLLLVQVTQLPFGMALTGSKALRFQAFCAVGLALSTLALSILWGRALGPGGITLALACSVVLFQIVPQVIYVKKGDRDVEPSIRTR